MFKFARFWFYALQMRRSYYAAERAEDDERVFQFLRKARQAGRTALQIQSPFISQKIRAAMTRSLVAVHGLYQRGLIARIPEEDLELVVSAMTHMKVLADMGIPPNVNQVVSAINTFEIAKSRLDLDAKVSSIIYGSEYVPAPLRNIMQPFLAGEATREETEKRLDECVGKLRKWLPELILFPEELPPQ